MLKKSLGCSTYLLIIGIFAGLGGLLYLGLGIIDWMVNGSSNFVLPAIISLVFGNTFANYKEGTG